MLNPWSRTFHSRYVVTSAGHVTTINARIILNGNGTGTYVLDSGAVGALTVTFHPGNSAPPGPVTHGHYTGTWSLNGTGGTFRWALTPSGNAFTGSWFDDAGNLGGPWNGQE